jgi:hypothetical protein
MEQSQYGCTSMNYPFGIIICTWHLSIGSKNDSPYTQLNATSFSLSVIIGASISLGHPIMVTKLVAYVSTYGVKNGPITS